MVHHGAVMAVQGIGFLGSARVALRGGISRGRQQHVGVLLWCWRKGWSFIGHGQIMGMQRPMHANG